MFDFIHYSNYGVEYFAALIIKGPISTFAVILEKGRREIRVRGEAAFAPGKEKGLRVGSLPAHTRQVHQHVRRPRRP